MNTESDSSDSSSAGSSVRRVKSKKYKTKEELRAAIVKDAMKKEFVQRTGKLICNYNIKSCWRKHTKRTTSRLHYNITITPT